MLAGQAQQRQLDLLHALNEEHLAEHPGELDLQARIASYELAAKMQTAAKEALDISNEPDSIKKLYGVDDPKTRDYGTRCLIARRLVERGVRFVQVLNTGQSWDQHGAIITALPANCGRHRSAERGARHGSQAARPARLHRRALGRRNGPAARAAKRRGRETNAAATTTPTASPCGSPAAVSKRGCVHGETDEFGHQAVKDIVHHYD